MDLLTYLLEYMDREYPLNPGGENQKRSDLLHIIESEEFKRAVDELKDSDVIFLGNHLPALKDEYRARIREERGAPFPYSDPKLEEDFSAEVNSEAAQWVNKAAWILIPRIRTWRRWNDGHAAEPGAENPREPTRPGKGKKAPKTKGRPKDPEIVERIKILNKAGIKSPADLRIEKKLRQAFAMLTEDAKKHEIPGFPGETDWMNLFESSRGLDLAHVRDTLRQNLNRKR